MSASEAESRSAWMVRVGSMLSLRALGSANKCEQKYTFSFGASSVTYASISSTSSGHLKNFCFHGAGPLAMYSQPRSVVTTSRRKSEVCKPLSRLWYEVDVSGFEPESGGLSPTPAMHARVVRRHESNVKTGGDPVPFPSATSHHIGLAELGPRFDTQPIYGSVRDSRRSVLPHWVFSD
jgi:hypothetical protein